MQQSRGRITVTTRVGYIPGDRRTTDGRFQINTALIALRMVCWVRAGGRTSTASLPRFRSLRRSSSGGADPSYERIAASGCPPQLRAATSPAPPVAIMYPGHAPTSRKTIDSVSDAP